MENGFSALRGSGAPLEGRRPLVLIGCAALIVVLCLVASVRLAQAADGGGFAIEGTEGAAGEQAEPSDSEADGGGGAAPAGVGRPDDGAGDEAGEEGATADAAGGEGKASPDAAPSGTELFVHVGGSVAEPGVYRLTAGSRVADAVEAAGGLAEGAARDAVNLARPLQDGERIIVPSEEDLEDAPGGAFADWADQGAPSAWEGGGASGETGRSDAVNINAASAEELESLPGIGPSLSQRIVASREAEGPFSSCEDLMRVSGIGQKKYDALADAICVG